MQVKNFALQNPAVQMESCSFDQMSQYFNMSVAWQTEIQNYLLPYGSLGHTGNDPSRSQTIGEWVPSLMFLFNVNFKMCPQDAGN